MDLVQLDALCSNLDTATKNITDLYQSKTEGGITRNTSFSETSALFTVSPDDEEAISTARKNLSSLLSRLQTLVAGPSSFLQQLATQTQVLACIKWLGETQVIACIPLSGSVSIEELADLADVPELILSRTVRMTATAGFLHEPELGFVAHTVLSASFSTELSYFDAAMFLSNQVAPSALHLHSGSPKKERLSSLGMDDTISNSNYSIGALYTGNSRGPRLTRQCLAYRDSIGGTDDDSLTDLFRQLNWQSLGEATIVYACAKYTRETSQALQHLTRTLRIVVQITDPQSPGSNVADNPRIRVQCRRPADPQLVKDAAVYIVRPHLSTPASNGQSTYDLLVAELHSHFDVLRANPTALLIVAPILLPEPGSVDLGVEVQARLRDFSHLHLGNECAMEVAELAQLIEGVSDQNGRLVISNRLRSANGAAIALAAQYQRFSRLAM